MLKPHWFQILLSVAEGPMHGLAIQEEVLQRTDGEMHLWPATLYRSLQHLEEAGLLREVSSPDGSGTAAGQPRYYRLTGDGHAELGREVERLERYVEAARAKRVGEV